MYPQTTSPPDNLPKYSATRKIEFLKALKRLEFSGKLIWSDTAGHQWTMFLSNGRVVYATGGTHSIRRWRRHLSARHPHLKLDIKTLEYELSTASSIVLSTCWEYQILHTWVSQQRITEQDAAQIIQDIMVEILFDIAQAPSVTYQIGRCPPLTAEFSPIQIDDEAAFTAAQKLWYVWSEANLGSYFPGFAPKIQDAERIQAATSPQTYRTLSALLTGQHALWDLAVKTQRSILQLAQALNPYIQSGWIELTELAEEPVPTVQPRPPRSPISEAPVSVAPLVACIDDSLTVCHSLEQVISGAGYRFVAVMEASRAIATLLAKKPDIIFLDLIMPETNGYDICSYLRKLSLFKQTPIVILSGTDGVVDQVRARLLGASDFISKPVEPDVILTIIRKHLGAAALP